MTLSGKLARREIVDLELPSWSTESRRKPPPMKELANVACQFVISSFFITESDFIGGNPGNRASSGATPMQRKLAIGTCQIDEYRKLNQHFERNASNVRKNDNPWHQGTSDARRPRIPQIRVSNTRLAQAASGCAPSVDVLPIFDVKQQSARNPARMGGTSLSRFSYNNKRLGDNGGMNEQTTKVNLTSEYPDENLICFAEAKTCDTRGELSTAVIEGFPELKRIFEKFHLKKICSGLMRLPARLVGARILAVLPHSALFAATSEIGRTSTLGAQPLAACASQCSKLVVEES
ncbi:hypothetical protein WN51_04329 [Melipona quadrifasciata]|uniref:Uncharacterized protein n=1 Tax=Melipona quadrifasciata TaxID=166423 RepID=A0A0N0BCP2_9HYME|nr:hypothetical protein WN51_04329 [Melipona quadrifasciata]